MLYKTRAMGAAVGILCLPFAMASASAATPFAGTWRIVDTSVPFDPGPSDLVIEPFQDGLRVLLASEPAYAAASEAAQGLGRFSGQTIKFNRVSETSLEISMGEHGRIVQQELLEISGNDRLLRSVTILGSDGSRSNSTYSYRRGSKAKDGNRFVGHWKLEPQATKAGVVPQLLLVTESGSRLTWSEPTSQNRLTVDLKSLAIRMSGAVPKDLQMNVKRWEAHALELEFTGGPISGTTLYEVSEGDTHLTVRNTIQSADGKVEVKSFEYVRQ